MSDKRLGQVKVTIYDNGIYGAGSNTDFALQVRVIVDGLAIVCDIHINQNFSQQNEIDVKPKLGVERIRSDRGYHSVIKNTIICGFS